MASTVQTYTVFFLFFLTTPRSIFQGSMTWHLNIPYMKFQNFFTYYDYFGCFRHVGNFLYIKFITVHLRAIFRKCLFVCLIWALGICFAIVGSWNDNNTYCDNKYHQQNSCPTDYFGLLRHNSDSADSKSAIFADFTKYCFLFWQMHLLVWTCRKKKC